MYIDMYLRSYIQYHYLKVFIKHFIDEELHHCTCKVNNARVNYIKFSSLRSYLKNY